MLGQRGTLELGRAKLCLEVAEPGLDLEQDGFGCLVEDDVPRAPVRRATDGNLESRAPARVRLRTDEAGQLQLARISEPDAVGRVQPDRELTPHGRGEAGEDLEAGIDHAALHLAHQRLRDASPPRDGDLRQAGRSARGSEVDAEPPPQLSSAFMARARMSSSS